MSSPLPAMWLVAAALCLLLGHAPALGYAADSEQTAASLADCTFEGSYPELMRGRAEGRLDYKQGGLGDLATSEYKVWMCVRPHRCATSDLE
jgi:hypothetical protein